ncbi:hypothetical protein MMC28_004912 [Mycoblastus sanguinarius]|nr:hypothetical protein [Mycoblastus sanguinarius]
MIIFRSSVVLAVATLGATIALNTPNDNLPLNPTLPVGYYGSGYVDLPENMTTENTTHPINSTFHLNPLPNPYLIPGTPITLDFIIHSPGTLPEDDVNECLAHARSNLQQALNNGGDRPLDSVWKHWLYGPVDFSIFATGQPLITINQTIVVVDGFSTKMIREGYGRVHAHVYLTEGYAQIGDAFVVMPL